MSRYPDPLSGYDIAVEGLRTTSLLLAPFCEDVPERFWEEAEGQDPELNDEGRALLSTVLKELAAPYHASICVEAEFPLCYDTEKAFLIAFDTTNAIRVASLAIGGALGDTPYPFAPIYGLWRVRDVLWDRYETMVAERERFEVFAENVKAAETTEGES